MTRIHHVEERQGLTGGSRANCLRARPGGAPGRPCPRRKRRRRPSRGTVPPVTDTAARRYIYKGSNLTPGRLVEELIRTGVASPGARGMDIEDALNQIAGANGIDRDTADSAEFPRRWP